jgi:hypothetical protein
MDARQAIEVYLFGLSERLQASAIPFGAIAGFLLLADLPTLAIRTALTGGVPTFVDYFMLCPGLHRQHLASQLNQAEYPACAALTTGYVFRVENPATVYYLQRISTTGAVTNLNVTRETIWPVWYDPFNSFASAWYDVAAPLLYFVLLGFFQGSEDKIAFVVLVLLLIIRAVNITLTRLRSLPKWHGQSEPGIRGDLLILLSQDRWVRMRGLVDDLKATTSGQWLRDLGPIEGAVQSVLLLATYGTAGLCFGMTPLGGAPIIALMLVSAGLVGLANARTRSLAMHGCCVTMDKEKGVKKYGRRLDMVEDMLKEEDRNDEAMRKGLSQTGVTVPKTASKDGGSLTM